MSVLTARIRSSLLGLKTYKGAIRCSQGCHCPLTFGTAKDSCLCTPMVNEESLDSGYGWRIAVSRMNI